MNPAADVYGPQLPGIDPKKAMELRECWNTEAFLATCSLPPAGQDYARRALLRPSRELGNTTNRTRFVTGVHDVSTTESDVALTGFMLGLSDPGFLRMAAEPPMVCYSVKTASGATANRKKRPDALGAHILAKIYVMEFKSRAKFEKLCIDEPELYQRNDDGSFRSDPVATVFREQFGIEYVLVATDDCPPQVMRSLVTLRPYFLSELRHPVTAAERKAVLDAVAAQPGIAISDIPIKDPARRLDVVKRMSVGFEIFPSYQHGDIQQPELVPLYPTPIHLQAATVFHALSARSPGVAVPFSRRLPPGIVFNIGKRQFRVIHHTANAVVAHNLETNLPQTIAHGCLDATDANANLTTSAAAVPDVLEGMDEDRLAGFLDEWRRVSAVAIHGLTTDRGDRQLRRKVDLFTKHGARALITRSNERGWKGYHKSDPRSTELLEKVIEQQYLKPAGVSARMVFALYRVEAQRIGISEGEQFVYRSVARRIAAIRKFKATLAREGARSALKFRPATTALSPMGPANGIAPCGTAHVDHTRGDVLVFNRATGKYERPWISFMIDGYSGAVLAFVVWFRPPQTDTVIALLVDCLQRHGCLPWKIRSDHGREFLAERIETVAASLGVSWSYRPAGEPRSGSPVEAAFNALNQGLLHQLDGTTKLRVAGRELTKDMKPENFTRWTMECFIEIMNEYVETHNRAPREDKAAPDKIVADYVAKHGSHCKEWSWLSVELLRRLCAHAPALGLTRIVSNAASVRARSCEYMADELQDLVGQKVRVFVDALDARLAYVDHPETRKRITCRAVTSAVAYARDAAEANDVVEARLAGSDARRAKAAEAFGELLEMARAMEKNQGVKGSAAQMDLGLQGDDVAAA